MLHILYATYLDNIIHWSRQTNDFKIDTCRFLARPSALLGYGKNWLAQCQDNVTVGYQAMVLAASFPSESAL